MGKAIDVQLLFDQGLSVLLEGESGTGKSWLAKTLHNNSQWKTAPFVVVNLATITDSLMESELFGHVKGAFTGAFNNRVGFVESVSEGTLFLDEIGELSFDMQKKLLRLLEDKTFSIVGSTAEKKFKGHLLFATNKDLKEMVLKGKFREDLYYRLLVAKKEIAPLRAEVQMLNDKIEYFWKEYTDHYNKHDHYISAEVLEYLKSYDWPGNIRELKNCIQYLAIVSSGRILTEDLPDWILGNEKIGYKISEEKFINIENLPHSYEKALEIFEKKYLEYVLRMANGRINQTAKDLGISKVTLIAKSRKYGINSMAVRFEHHQAMIGVA